MSWWMHSEPTVYRLGPWQDPRACSAGMGGIQFKTITLAIDISVAVFVAFRNRSRLAQGGLFPELQKQLVL